MSTEQSGAAGLVAVGVSDLIAHRECPRRAAYGARRHIEEGVQDPVARTPEAGSPATWYGSMIHDAIEASEDGYSDEAAVELAWATWGHHLDPEDLTLLKEDLEKYHERDAELGELRTVLSEGEIRVPLCTLSDGRVVYFRARIDRLYERLDLPGHFIHVDYKSSKWVKSQEEVDKDVQMWAYNWIIHEYFPIECESLEQWVDFLRGGMVLTSKTEEQRIEIREWLIIEAKRYFGEHEILEDDLPAPTFNQWCPWCPILESCSIIPQLSDWAQARISVLGVSITGSSPIQDYIDQYDDAQTAIKTLERYVESVKQLIRDADAPTRNQLGFELRGRRASIISPQARKELLTVLGPDRFTSLVGITQEALKKIEDPEEREWALSLVEKVQGNKTVYRRRL